MKKFTCTFLAVLLVGCAAQNPSTVTIPTNPSASPNAGLIIALDTLEAGCEVSSTLVSPAAAVWLSGPCPTAVAGITTIVTANGTIAQIQAVISTLQTTSAAIPGLTAKDQSYITAAITLANSILAIYKQETGQSSLVVPNVAFAFADAHKLKLTKVEKEQLKAIKARAQAKLKK